MPSSTDNYVCVTHFSYHTCIISSHVVCSYLFTTFSIMHFVLHYLYTYFYIVCFNFFAYAGLSTTVVPNSSLSVMVNCSPLRQQNILVVSQPSSLVSTVSDTHTTTSPVTILSVVECLTTSSSVVTSISGQHVSTITTAGVYIIV